MAERHYLGHGLMVGEQMRYVAEAEGQWVALVGWSAGSYHLKGREQWIGWTVEQRLKRRKFAVQNSRFLLLVAAQQYPNLASRVLGLCARRLRMDWRSKYGHEVLAAESFIDPQRFSGACYRAAGWQRLGATQGCRRTHRDFYEEDGTPKELWVRPLHPQALKWLRAETMPERYAAHEDAAMHCPYTAQTFDSLWEYYVRLLDPRRTNGRRHRQANVLVICTLAVMCGARGPRAIAEFAENLTKTQRRLLNCYFSPKRQRYEVPSETTIRRILAQLPAGQFDQAVNAWMAEHDPHPLRQLAADGKAVKGARHADGRALHLVAAINVDSRRVCAQTAVAEKSNEIPALPEMLADVPLDGVCVSADAAHTQHNTARFLVQHKGADYLLVLKDNQPTVRALAQRAIGRAFSPSGIATGPNG